MEEPLCTFEMYPLFKFLCDEMQTAKAPYDSIIKSLQEVMIQYPPVYRDTWRFVLTFLSVIADSNPKLTAHNIATVFSDILFRPTEYNSADMVLWRLFTNLLTLMITDHRRIFEVVDMKLKEEKMQAQRDTLEVEEEKKSKDDEMLQRLAREREEMEEMEL